MERKLVAAVLLLVSYKFLFLSGTPSHVKIGLIWLAVDAAFWLPELGKLKAKLF